ncbi:hypothetical protein E4U54_001312 [Claviceps lovelessii]|nr:hypothetical protein E4U54_001312 [Claviceps lovelessii]
MAIVPALADSPFHMLCPRSLWNGAGDEQQFYRTLYRNFCQSEQYNCRDLMDGPTGFNFGENWVEAPINENMKPCTISPILIAAAVVHAFDDKLDLANSLAMPTSPSPATEAYGIPAGLRLNSTSIARKYNAFCENDVHCHDMLLSTYALDPDTKTIVVQQSIMKLSIISALSMAAIPALASSYSFICKRELYNGDPRQETAFFDVFYHEYCTRYFKCESYMIPRIQYSDRDKVITGLCLMCPPGLSTNPSGSMCTLAPN